MWVFSITFFSMIYLKNVKSFFVSRISLLVSPILFYPTIALCDPAQDRGFQGTLNLYPKGVTADVHGCSILALGPDFKGVDGISRLLRGWRRCGRPLSPVSSRCCWGAPHMKCSHWLTLRMPQSYFLLYHFNGPQLYLLNLKSHI